jgi:glyoxylase-like metal-dependent hydrolase (beta-lactamase superfamily II)
MLNEVADGVWVRQSEWVWSNTTVIRTDEGLVVVDPGITGAELDELADDVEQLGVPVVAGFSTHPHFDHLLWHSRLGDVPRYATPANAELAAQARERAQAMAAETAPDIPLDVVALLTPIPEDQGAIPGELLVHDAHAVGHAALFLADRGVLVAGDMLSDVLPPMLDPRRTGQLEAYDAALGLLGKAIEQVAVVIPGHGEVARGDEARARLEADRAYLDALRNGTESGDPRLEQDWVRNGPHQTNLQQAGAS